MRFLLADVTIDWDLPENEVHAWFHHDGVIGALPFGAQKWRLIIERAREAGRRAGRRGDVVIGPTARGRTRLREEVCAFAIRSG